MALYGISKTNGEVNCDLIMINKQKLRDIPPFKVNQIKITKIKKGFQAVMQVNDYLPKEIDLLIVSGEFFAAIPLIKEKIHRDCMIIGVPIGFEVEDLCVRNRKALSQELVEQSLLISKGLSLCDYIAQNNNTSPPIKEELIKCNCWDKRLAIYHQINIIRCSLSNKLINIFSKYTKAHEDQKDLYDQMRNTVFLATRISSSKSASVNNKGSDDLFDALCRNASKYFREDIHVLLIDRDDLSRRFIKELRTETSSTNLKIKAVRELNYTQYIYLLSKSMLAIDSFSPSNALRPHMATSDALSVGCPVLTSWGQATNRELVDDERLNIVDASVLDNPDKLVSLITLSSSKRRKQIQDLLYSKYYNYTDNAESAQLIALASGNFTNQK